MLDLHAEAKSLKLKSRKEQDVLNFMFDQAQNLKLLKQKPEHQMQTQSYNKQLLKVKRPKLEKYKKSFAYQGPKNGTCCLNLFTVPRPKNCSNILLLTSSQRNLNNPVGVQTALLMDNIGLY